MTNVIELKIEENTPKTLLFLTKEEKATKSTRVKDQDLQQLVCSNNILFVDIEEYSTFQNLHTPQGLYWCEFYGGRKNYRCFLVSEHLRRAELLQQEAYIALLDQSINPIYNYTDIVVRQDPTHAMPGFYIVAPRQAYRSTDALDLGLYMSMRFIDFRVSHTLKESYNIKCLYRVNEERKVAYQNVHTWLLPLDHLPHQTSIEEWNTLEYMLKFASWRQYKKEIISLNKKMKAELEHSKLQHFANLWSSILKERAHSLLINDDIHSNITEQCNSTQGVIYENKHIFIKRAPGILGHYVVMQTHTGTIQNLQYREKLYLRMNYLAYQLRVILRQQLNIEYAYKLSEENTQYPECAPIFILPITDISKYNRIYHFKISEYKESFKNAIINDSDYAKTDNIISTYIKCCGLIEKDNILSDIIDQMHHRHQEG